MGGLFWFSSTGKSLSRRKRIPLVDVAFGKGLCEGVHVEPMLASLALWVSLGSLLEVDLGFVKVSMLSGC